MEYEIMYLCNFLGVAVLFSIAAITLIGVEKENNTETFEMWLIFIQNQFKVIMLSGISLYLSTKNQNSNIRFIMMLPPNQATSFHLLKYKAIKTKVELIQSSFVFGFAAN